MTNNSILNTQKIKIPAKFLWFGFVVLVVISVAVVNYLWLNGSFGITPFKNKSSVVINGGSLGAVATAIQLSDLGVDFVLVEPNNQLGGQATVQGVSTFDQHNRAFQYNKLYSQMLKSMQAVDKVFDVRSRGDSFGVDYWGNAITGPGALPKQIIDYFNSRIDSKYGRVIYNTEVVEVFKIGNKIDSVLIKNKNDNKTQRLQADLFLDAGEFSEISRFADVPYSFGMDLQEETGESQALNSQEMVIFRDGVNVKNGKVGGYGSRLQPITTPFALLDKGYQGNRYSASRLKSFSDAQTKLKTCANKRFQCLEIASGQELQVEFNQPYKGSQELSLVIGTNFGDPDWIQNIEIQINKQIFRGMDLENRVYTPQSDFSVIKLPFQTQDASLNIRFNNFTGQNIDITEFILSGYQQNRKSVASSLSEISTIATYIGQVSQVEENNDVQTIFKLENLNLEPDQQYYVIPSFIKDLDYEQYTRRINVNIYSNVGKEFETQIDPNSEYFENYFPFYSFKGNQVDNYTITFNPIDERKIPIDKVMLVPADKIEGFRILSDKEQYTFQSPRLIDVISQGNFSHLGISISKESQGQNLSLTRPFKESTTIKTRFISRQLVDGGDTIKVNSESSNSQVLLIDTNETYFFNQIYNNFENQAKSYFYPTDAGKFKLLIRTKQSQDTTDKIDFVLRLTNQPELAQSIVLDKNRFIDLGQIKVEQDTLNFRLEPKCNSGCIDNIEVILQEEVPKDYDADFFNTKVTYSESERKVFSEGSIIQDTFRFRRIVDPVNFLNHPEVPAYIKSRINFNSLGIGQINTGYNDFEMDGVDLQKLLLDKDYRQQVYDEAKSQSLQYYYWLKFDAPKALYGCKVQELFCSGARLSLSPEAMGTSDGLSSYPYIRDPVRTEGQKQLTFNEISVKSNVCEIESEDCLKITLDGSDYLVQKSFFSQFNDLSIASFYYPTDIHRMVKYLKPFNDYLLNNNFRTKENLPEFIFGLYDGAVKAGTIDFGHIFNPKVDNLMFCGKNISTTQIANGSTRLHPAEVAVGQACGVIASYLLENKISAVSELNSPERFRSVQAKMVQNGSVIAPLDDNELFVLLREEKWEVLLAYYRAILDKFVEVEVSQDAIKQFVLLRILPNQNASGQDLQKLSEKLGWQSFLIDTNLSSTSLEDLIKTAPNEARDKIISAVQFHQQALVDVGLAQSRPIDDGYQLTRGDLAMIASYFTT